MNTIKIYNFSRPTDMKKSMDNLSACQKVVNEELQQTIKEYRQLLLKRKVRPLQLEVLKSKRDHLSNNVVFLEKLNDLYIDINNMLL